MRKSPFTITYTDLGKWTKTQLKYAQERKLRAEGNGVTNLQALTRDVECAKKLAEMLRKCEPGRQADLFEIFESTKR